MKRALRTAILVAALVAVAVFARFTLRLAWESLS